MVVDPGAVVLETASILKNGTVFDEEAATRQLQRLAATKAQRDQGNVSAALEDLVRVARTGESIMPATIEAVRARATAGEIVNALKPLFGLYSAKPVF